MCRNFHFHCISLSCVEGAIDCSQYAASVVCMST
uniref:Uncharacterized protein n=1 Tax=Rhizophora mucronata TaxID=61149 RepID=A0A2P2J3V3_RHIMU